MAKTIYSPLNDVRLMTLPSDGDVVAKELSSHRSCITNLYNRGRAHFEVNVVRKNWQQERKRCIQSSSQSSLFILLSRI
jgi:hypothetical protein